MRITDGSPDDVKPCGLIREIVFLGVIVQDVYGPAIAHLEKIGYREGVDLFIFDYDWRRSVFDNAARLEGFVREKIPNPSQRFDIVAHSMGGLIARVFAQRHDNASQLARLFSAGTPFQGSAKVYVMVEKGWGALNSLMGGLPAFRRTMLSFPSAYELAAALQRLLRRGRRPRFRAWRQRGLARAEMGWRRSVGDDGPEEGGRLAPRNCARSSKRRCRRASRM